MLWLKQKILHQRNLILFSNVSLMKFVKAQVHDKAASYGTILVFL